MDTTIKTKKLYCDKCGKEVGEIKKGRIMKGVILVCKECQIPKKDSLDYIKDMLGM